MEAELAIADMLRRWENENNKLREYKQESAGSPAPDPSLLLDLLRLSQQAMSPGEPAHFGTPEQVVERADVYWNWIKEQQA